MTGIEFGSQIVEFIRIKLIGVADNLGGPAQVVRSCLLVMPLAHGIA